MHDEDEQDEVQGFWVMKSPSARIAQEEFLAAAKKLGLIHHKTFEKYDKSDSYEEIWSTQDKTVAVHYVEDPVSGMSYISVRGEDVADILWVLLPELDVFGPEELISKVVQAEDYDDIIDDLFRLAIMFPEYEERVFMIFERTATLAPYPRLRAAALNAMAYRGWGESLPIVERVAREDPEPDLRQEAARLLPLWQKEVRATSNG